MPEDRFPLNSIFLYKDRNYGFALIREMRVIENPRSGIFWVMSRNRFRSQIRNKSNS